jgi:hypothetical protein
MRWVRSIAGGVCGFGLSLSVRPLVIACSSTEGEVPEGQVCGTLFCGGNGTGTMPS